MAPPAFVFDLDGTLWDSAPWFARLLSEETNSDPDLLRTELVGGSSVVAVIKDFGISRSRLMSRARAAIGELELFPGVREALTELSGRRTPMAIFTSLPGSIAAPLLTYTGLEKFFPVTMHAGNSPRKPSPVGIRNALANLGIAHSRGVFYVGDRDVDSRTAENAQVSFAWASYGYQKETPAYVTARLRSAYDLVRL